MAERLPRDWSAHRRAAQEEDLRFLVDQGVPEEEALRRVNLQPDTLAQRVRRHPERSTA